MGPRRPELRKCSSRAKFAVCETVPECYVTPPTMTLKKAASPLMVTVATLILGLPSACLRPPEPASEPKSAADQPAATAASAAPAPVVALKIVDSSPGQAPNDRLKVSIDANRPVRTINKRRFLGTNIAIWNQSATFLDPEVKRQFHDAGIGLVRMPGGSASDQYFWNGNGVRHGDKIDRSKYHDGKWAIDYSKWAPGFLGFFGFPKDPLTAELRDWHGNSSVKEQLDFIKSLGADSLITVNAGTGTPRDAAEWVKWANRAQGYGVKFWEVGNELGGSWEAGTVRADGKTLDGAGYGAIYREFAKAIKGADPKALVGSQGGLDFIKGALAQKDAPIDFVTYHDYFSSEASSPAALFQTLNKIKSAIAEVREAVTKARPGKEILVGMTEFNSQLFEGSQTSDVNSGLWLTAALLEMMYGGLDFATQWDSFTQKPDKGGGHGFMIEQGAVPKSEYWTYVVLNRFVGNKLLKVDAGSADVRSYASSDESGSVSLIAVNTSQTKGYDVDLQVAGAQVAPIADCVRFSGHEYDWDPEQFTTPWNSGPSELRVQVTGATIPMLPASLLACKLARAKPAPSLVALGPSRLDLIKGAHASLEVVLLGKDGKVASSGLVQAQGDQGFAVEPAEVKVDSKGRAHFEVTAPASATAGHIQLTSAGVAPVSFATSSVEPELIVRGPARAPRGETVSLAAAVRYKKGNRHALVDSFSQVATVQAPGVSPVQINLTNGLGSLTLTAGAATTAGLELKAGALSTRFEVAFFESKTTDKLVYQFDDPASLSHATGKLPYRINSNVRPNEGVLEMVVQDAQGWTQDVVSLDKLNEIAGLDRAGIQAVSFDLGTSDTFASGGQFAELVIVLQSEANYWMPLEKLDLKALTKGKFKRVTLAIKPEFQKAMKAFYKLIVVVNSGAKLDGSVYIDNLGFQVQSSK